MMTAAEPPHGKVPERSHQAFERLAEPFRRELKVHCYRMLGSVHEAEDVVQETYLRAWRSYDNFEGSGSFRAWLYRIATNACLNALASRKQMHRLLPDRYAPVTVKMPEGKPSTEVAWLEPYPDSELEGIADHAPNPEARYASREAVQLAFVAAIQQLPPRHRAALLLCDVLAWSAAEAAKLLDGTTASVNSALQRARGTLGKLYSSGQPQVARPVDLAQQKLLDRYLRAWHDLDINSFVAVLKEDATLTMPPWPQWYVGRDSIRTVFTWAWRNHEGRRLIPSAANGQPAFACYARNACEAPWTAHSIQVLTLENDLIAGLTLFLPPTGPDLFDAFGLPLTLPDVPMS